MTSNCAHSSAAGGLPAGLSGKLWFIPAAISALDGLTTLLDWMNFAHHGTAHGVGALGLAVVFAVCGFLYSRRPKAA